MNTTQEKRRKKRRKKVRRPPLFYILLVLLAIVITVVVIINTVFKINTVLVVGNTTYEKSKIEITSGLVEGDNYFFIDKDLAIERIESNYSYLEGTKIKYQMFSTVVIEVQDAKPSFAIQTDLGYALISPNFKVLEYPAVEATGGIPVVNGLNYTNLIEGEILTFDDTDGKLRKEALLEVMNAMNSQGLTNVNTIDVSDLYDIRLLYENRVIILFGSKGKSEKKARALNELINIRFPSPQIVRIDCSYEEDEDNPRCYVLPLTSLEQWDQMEAEKEELYQIDPNTVLSSNSSENSSEDSSGNSSKSSESSKNTSNETTSSRSSSSETSSKESTVVSEESSKKEETSSSKVLGNAG